MEAWVETWLEALGAHAITYTRNTGEPVFLEAHDESKLWELICVTAILGEPIKTPHETQLNQRLADQSISHWEQAPVPKQDWVSACQQQHQAKRYGKRIWVCPSWDMHTAQNDEVILQLDPGLAFGTGTHPTTALCLEALDHHIQPHATLIDYGCGSGILAIAGILLGANHAYGIDHDPQALEATKSNALKNGVKNRLIVGSDTPATAIAQSQILVANILLNPLMTLAPRLAALVSPGGLCILSGILTHQKPLLEPHYLNQFTTLAMRERDDWACWILQKR